MSHKKIIILWVIFSSFLSAEDQRLDFMISYRMVPPDDAAVSYEGFIYTQYQILSEKGRYQEWFPEATHYPNQVVTEMTYTPLGEKLRLRVMWDKNSNDKLDPGELYLKDENFLVPVNNRQTVSIPLSIYSGKSIPFRDYMESCAYFGDELVRPCLE